MMIDGIHIELPALSSEKIETGVAIYLEDDKKLLTLNSTASFIWNEVFTAHEAHNDITTCKIAVALLNACSLPQEDLSMVVDDTKETINTFFRDGLIIMG